MRIFHLQSKYSLWNLQTSTQIKTSTNPVAISPFEVSLDEGESARNYSKYLRVR